MIEPENDRPLWRAVAAAVVVAAVILLTVVLPAEYGIDPTSIGRLLGLDRLDTPAAVRPESPAPAAATDELAEIMGGNTVAADPAAHAEYAASFAEGETLIRLDALEEVEVKARMGEGDTLVYSWQAEGPVYVDTHGEPFDDPDSPAVRYLEKDDVTALHGRITAPFAGQHGWYWLNTGEVPITITLKTSGFYRDLGEIYRGTQ